MSLYPRTSYELTQEQWDFILNASKPTPAMWLSGGTPMFGTPQENANAAWHRLGAEMGFDYMTVQPDPSKGDRFFTAIPSETDAQRSERKKREDLVKKTAEIERLKSEISAKQLRIAELESQ